MALRYLALAVLCFAFVYIQSAQAKTFGQSEACLGCICEAASGCNTEKGCELDVCGPYRITYGYWTDAGKPTVNGQLGTEKNAFANCANDLFCATKAVLKYTERYAKDCNSDGNIDCDDYTPAFITSAATVAEANCRNFTRLPTSIVETNKM